MALWTVAGVTGNVSEVIIIYIIRFESVANRNEILHVDQKGSSLNLGFVTLRTGFVGFGD